METSAWRSPLHRQLVGLGFVVLFHALIIYALAAGLAKRVIDVVHGPIETRVIEETKRPPPPAEVLPPPPLRLETPPTPYIPPPEVHIAAPPPLTNTITVVTQTPPPVPAVIAPVAPPVMAPPAAAPAPVAAPAPPISAAVVCSNYTTVMGDAGYPHEAQRAGISKGEALIEFTLDASGHVRNIKVVRASHPIFARNSMRIVADYKCQGQGHDVQVQVPFGYKLE